MTVKKTSRFFITKFEKDFLTGIVILQNPRPHISLAWALGDVSSKLKQATKEIGKFENSINSSKNCNLRCNFSLIVCKVGKKVYDICKIED